MRDEGDRRIGLSTIFLEVDGCVEIPGAFVGVVRIGFSVGEDGEYASDGDDKQGQVSNSHMDSKVGLAVFRAYADGTAPGGAPTGSVVRALPASRIGDRKVVLADLCHGLTKKLVMGSV